MRINSHITLYNKYVDPTTRSEKYQRTVIREVYWENRRAANKARGGEIAANQATVYIPLARKACYREPREWADLVAKVGLWTLQDGDYIVRGVVADEITGTFTVSSLKAKYDDVMQITSVDLMDMGSPNVQHWQVEAS